MLSRQDSLAWMQRVAAGLFGVGLIAFSLGCPPDDPDGDTGTTPEDTMTGDATPEDTGPDDTGGEDTGGEDTSGADTSADDTGTDTMADTTAGDTGGGDADDGGSADPARAMIVHNAADPAASEVDVFLDGNLLIDDFAFRTALPFSDVPAGEHTVAIAGSDTGSAGSDTTLDDDESALGSWDLTFESGQTYVAVANGVRPGQGFAENPDGEEIALDLAVKPMAKEDSSADGDTDEVAVFHGVTDAPTIDARLDNAGTPQIEGLTYGNFTDYLEVPSGLHTIDVETEDNSTRVASLQTGDLPGGQAWVVTASGFLDPDANNGGEGLALVAYPAQDSSQTDIISGTALDAAARVQIVHAAPQGAVDPVDVWEKNTGSQLVDDLAYENATPFVTVPGGVSLDVGVAPSDSSSAGDTIASQSVTFSNGATRVVVASGVTDASNFEVDSANFGLRAGSAREAGSSSSEVDLNIFHGATDAPAVDVVTADESTTFVEDFTFGNFTGITSVSPANYTLAVKASASGNTAATFDVPLANAGGAYRTVVASGFLTPTGDPVDSSTFKLLAVAPDGSVTPVMPNN